MSVSVDTRVEDQIVNKALAAARREVNNHVKIGLKAAATRVGLPRAKLAASSVVAPYLTVGATTRGVFITTRGPKVYDRIAGLQEFGGSVTSDIFPKNKKAVMTPWGPRAVVRRGPFVGRPATYKAQRRIGKSAEKSAQEMARIAEPEIVKAFGSLVG